MTQARCSRCFKSKELVPPVPGSPPSVCKSCSYEIDTVLGFLEYQAMQLPMDLDEPAEMLPAKGLSTAVPGMDDVTTPLPPKKKRKAAKEAAQAALDRSSAAQDMVRDGPDP